MQSFLDAVLPEGHFSLSARILHHAPPPPPVPSGPTFSNSENCCGSENAMPPIIFWDMEGHIGHFRSKTWGFFLNIFWKKFIINHTIFLIFRYNKVNANAVIWKNQKYLLKCVCIYRKNNPNGEFLSNFLLVSKFVLH